MSTPFWTFMIQIQTCTATTGVDRPDEDEANGFKRSAHQAVQRRVRSSAISVPPTIVRLTLTAVKKTTVRSSVSERIWSWRTLQKLPEPT